jgi:hypothetical protein
LPQRWQKLCVQGVKQMQERTLKYLNVGIASMLYCSAASLFTSTSTCVNRSARILSKRTSITTSSMASRIGTALAHNFVVTIAYFWLHSGKSLHFEYHNRFSCQSATTRLRRRSRVIKGKRTFRNKTSVYSAAHFCIVGATCLITQVLHAGVLVLVSTKRYILALAGDIN